MSDFDRAVALILDLEGGLVDDPHDLGGLTNHGISQRAYPDLNIRALTLDDAKAIYRRDYWEPIRCGEMPWGFGVTAFDAAVNQGPWAAASLLQLAVGAMADGKVGPKTLAAVNRAGPDELHDYFARRCVRYAQHARFEFYGRGWFRRIFRVAQAALG